MESSTNIIWSYEGKTDLTVGTQATTTEKILGWTAGFIGVIVIAFYSWKNNLD